MSHAITFLSFALICKTLDQRCDYFNILCTLLLINQVFSDAQDYFRRLFSKWG